MDGTLRNRHEILWVSIDGVECAGKSSLCQRLLTALPGTRLLPEFSPTPVGSHLRRSVDSSPHFISPSLLGQSLLFLADYAENAQAAATMSDPSVRVVLQDRGFLSKFVYQLVVLQSELGEAQARTLLKTIMSYLPRPDVTIFLDAPMSLIESRMRFSRPAWLTPERRVFVEEAIGVFRKEVGELEGTVFHLSQNPQDTVDDVSSLVLEKLKYVLTEVAASSGEGLNGERTPDERN